MGLPLHKRRLNKIEIQPLIDRVGGKLPTWKGKQMARAGRVTMVKAVLTAIITYYATVIPLPKWAIKKLDRICRNFICIGDDSETMSNTGDTVW